MDLLITLLLPLSITLLVAAVAAVIVALVTAAAIKIFSRQPNIRHALRGRLRTPAGVFAALVAGSIAAGTTGVVGYAGDNAPVVERTLAIACIAAGAWLVIRVISAAGDVLARRLVHTEDGNGHNRRMRTQVILLTRVAIAVVVILAIGATLFTFPGARAVGTSLLASAGLASVIAGLAAQSVLGNVFAGMQLAFSDAIRVDDVVVVEDEWGSIEEITLTYVVVHIWDDRRLVLPSTYFTSTPFANWSRRSSQIMGTVELDLDWRVPLDDMRAELQAVVARSDLWDGRTASLVVTEAVDGRVRVRILVSADGTDKIFDLRCAVREAMITWLRTAHPEALPVQRVRAIDPETPREAELAAAEGW